MALFALVTVLACGKTVPIGSDANSKLGAGDDDSDGLGDRDAGGAAPKGDGVVACPYGLPADHPKDPTVTYDRHCSTKAECTVGFHSTDCCGSQLALGIAQSEAKRFADGICGQSQDGPVCQCAALPPIAEDGSRSSTAAAKDIDVYCANETCQTHVVTFACGDSVCDSRTQYCKKFIPGVAAPDGGILPPSYNCEPISSACTNTPDCACFMDGMPAGNTCDESNGHVTVTLVGI